MTLAFWKNKGLHSPILRPICQKAQRRFRPGTARLRFEFYSSTEVQRTEHGPVLRVYWSHQALYTVNQAAFCPTGQVLTIYQCQVTARQGKAKQPKPFGNLPNTLSIYNLQYYAPSSHTPNCPSGSPSFRSILILAPDIRRLFPYCSRCYEAFQTCWHDMWSEGLTVASHCGCYWWTGSRQEKGGLSPLALKGQREDEPKVVEPNFIRTTEHRAELVSIPSYIRL